MKHRINGISLNLRELTQHELEALVKMAEERIAAAEDDKEKLMGELIRRSDNIYQLRFDLPPHHGYEGSNIT